LKQLHDLYSSPNIIRVIKSKRMAWAGTGGATAERRGAYKVLVAKVEGKTPPGRPRHRRIILK
jgi:hypothetical protein